MTLITEDMICRALTEQRFADEIKRLFDCLFNALLQRSRKAGKDSCDGSKSWDRLANYFASGGQWLALPSESHVMIESICVELTSRVIDEWPSLYLTFRFRSTPAACLAGRDAHPQPNGGHRLRGLGNERRASVLSNGRTLCTRNPVDVPLMNRKRELRTVFSFLL